MTKSKKVLRLAGYLFVCLLMVTSCKKNIYDSPKEITHGATGADLFISSGKLGTFTKAQLQAIATANGFASYVPLIQFDVDFFDITYKTTFKGETITASGLVGIPRNVPGTLSLLSAQHGTMFRCADAPSNFPSTFSGFELFASTGFVTLIPDFIGFGASQNIFQPYYDMESSGRAVVDMINAAKFLLNSRNVALNDKLFLVGYSEGGYVTLAAEREIENNPANHLTVTATAAGAGAYDLPTMMQGIATTPNYPDPSFLALILQAYDITYNWNRPLTDFFQEPYATRIPKLLNGSNNSAQINTQLNTNLTLLFNPAFYSNLSNPSSETTLKAKLQANSFPDWYPHGPTRLYHGTADEAVFFPTSLVAYNRFIAEGSKQLILIPIPAGTHETSVQPMFLDALQWFRSL